MLPTQATGKDSMRKSGSSDVCTFEPSRPGNIDFFLLDPTGKKVLFMKGDRD